MTSLLIKSAKLDESVAHHIRIGRETGLYLIHGVFGDLVPVFLVAINDFQLTAILMGYSRGHLEVLFRRAVPLFVLIRSYLDIEAIRMESHTSKLVYDHTTIHTARK